MIADKTWFKIQEQEMSMDEFYNANNRTWQLYLNITKLYSYSLFSNAVVFALEEPDIDATEIKFVEKTPEVAPSGKSLLHIETTPFNSTDTITFSSGTEANITVRKIDNRTVELTGVQAGTSIITATNGTVSATVTATCKNPETKITSLSYSSASVTVGDEGLSIELTVNPEDGNTPIYYTSTDTGVFTVEKDASKNNKCTLTGVADGTASLICTTGEVTLIIQVVVDVT